MDLDESEGEAAAARGAAGATQRGAAGRRGRRGGPWGGGQRRAIPHIQVLTGRIHRPAQAFERRGGRMGRGFRGGLAGTMAEEHTDATGTATAATAATGHQPAGSLKFLCFYCTIILKGYLKGSVRFDIYTHKFMRGKQTARLCYH